MAVLPLLLTIGTDCAIEDVKAPLFPPRDVFSSPFVEKYPALNRGVVPALVLQLFALEKLLNVRDPVFVDI